MIRRPVLLGIALLAGLAGPALAQQTTPQMNLQSAAGKKGPTPQQQVPAALPGAVSGPTTGRTTAGLKPNEALFDAVNRGDIGSAREALGRGADVDARNVLGLTPVQLSVDLGRNDITFLLLSMRNSGSGRTAALAPAPLIRGSTPPSRTATAPTPRAAPAPSRPVATVSAFTPGRDPGTPTPQAGFLGFGSSH